MGSCACDSVGSGYGLVAAFCENVHGHPSYIKERNCVWFFLIHGCVHRESNLITVQSDATYSV